MLFRTAFATGLLLLFLVPQTAPAQAVRALSTRTQGWRSSGSRPDITVPYLTTGYTAFMRDRYVGVRIYWAPMADDLFLPDVRPAYNLPFWGGIQAFSTRANGVMPTGLAVTPRELSPAVRPNAAMPVGTTLNSTGHR